MDLIPIIDKILNGNKDEFRRIITHCNQPLYRTAMAILKNEADAEDAMQSTYLKAYMHLAGFRKESSFLTWITRILVNECNMMLRKKQKVESLDSTAVMQQPSLTETAMDTLYKKQIQQWLEHAVLSLPDKYRLVYMIREINELSTGEAASALGLTEENIKVRLHRAKLLIRENLLQHVSAKELFPFGNDRCSRLTERAMEKIVLLPAVGYHNFT
jgi:RNA polymerase sigma-70 factor (ECF subfamily)